jgi:hypothetical protein
MPYSSKNKIPADNETNRLDQVALLLLRPGVTTSEKRDLMMREVSVEVRTAREKKDSSTIYSHIRSLDARSGEGQVELDYAAV